MDDITIVTFVKSKGRGVFGCDDHLVAEAPRLEPLSDPKLRLLILVIFGRVDEIATLRVVVVKNLESCLFGHFTHKSVPIQGKQCTAKGVAKMWSGIEGHPRTLSGQSKVRWLVHLPCFTKVHCSKRKRANLNRRRRGEQAMPPETRLGFWCCVHVEGLFRLLARSAGMEYQLLFARGFYICLLSMEEPDELKWFSIISGKRYICSKVLVRVA